MFRGKGTPHNSLHGGGGGGGGYVYKMVRILQVEVYESRESLSYFKGHLIKIFRTEAPYACINWFIRHYMKMTRISFFVDLFITRAGCESYVKVVPYSIKSMQKSNLFCHIVNKRLRSLPV